MYRYLLHNGRVQETSERSLSAGQTGLMNGWGVFSTIRVCESTLFAWPRHWARMRRDAALLRVPFPANDTAVLAALHHLIEANGVREATLRITVVRNRGGLFEGPRIERDYDWFAFLAPITEWGASARLGLKHNARHAASEFAGVKVCSWAFNLTWYEEAHERGFDEVVLLNERGEVSECTSANLFAVFGEVAATPPLHSGCLPGVTRALLLEQARVPGVRVEERTLRLEDMERADGVFLTSSTRDVMPVFSIDGLHIGGSVTVAHALGEELRNLRRQWVEEHAARAAG